MSTQQTERAESRFSYRAVLAYYAQAQIPTDIPTKDVDYSLERVARATQEAKDAGAPVEGFILPWDVPITQTRGIGVSLGAAGAGAAFNFTSAGSFIDMLRVRTSVVRAGARMIPGIPFFAGGLPKQTASGTAAWVGEDPGSNVSRSTWTTGLAGLAFKTVQAASAVSRQTLFSGRSGNYDLEQIIQEDLAKVLALAVDLAALNGLGSSNQPLGILNNTAVTTYAIGTNGGTLALLDACNIEAAVANANGDGHALAWVTSPNARKKARQTVGPNGQPLWDATLRSDPDGTMLGRTGIVSTAVPNNLTKGTSTTVCSALVFGAFEYLLIGMFGPGFDVQLDPFSMKLQNMIDISMSAYADVQVAQPAAFNVAKDLL